MASEARARQPDGSILSSGKNPERDTYTITAEVGLARVTAIRLEVMSDERLPKRGLAVEPKVVADAEILDRDRVVVALRWRDGSPACCHRS